MWYFAWILGLALASAFAVATADIIDRTGGAAE